MFKKESISKTIVLWLLLGFSFVYASYNIILAGVSFALAIVLILMWKQKRQRNATDHFLEYKNSTPQYIFLVFLLIIVFFLNDLKTFYPPNNVMLLSMSIVLYGAIGMLVLSIVLNKKR